MSRPTVHATAVVIGEAGVLIRGPSGAGKSQLAFALVDAARRDGLFAAFVADDRVELTPHGGRLVACVPETIAGLAERRGRGIETVAHVPAAIIRMVVDLVPADTLPRLPEEADRSLLIEGIRLQRQLAPARLVEVSVPLVMAGWREMNKF